MENSKKNHQTTQDFAKLLGLGVLAGVAGSFVMTAFQKLIEMPISQRQDSYAPAKLALRVLPINRPQSAKGMKGLNYATHFALGATWGAAYGIAAFKGLRGPRAVSRVFPAVFANDLATITVLGLDKPWKWTRQGFTIDVLDKFVQVAATSFIFDRFLDPSPTLPSHHQESATS